jgi:hypothetical protein
VPPQLSITPPNLPVGSSPSGPMTAEHYWSICELALFRLQPVGYLPPVDTLYDEPSLARRCPIVKPHAWNLSIVVVRCPQRGRQPGRDSPSRRRHRHSDQQGILFSGDGFCAGNDLNDFVADPPTGIRADRRPPRVLLWDRRWHPSRPERRPAVPPIKVRRRPGSSLSPSAGRRCL